MVNAIKNLIKTSINNKPDSKSDLLQFDTININYHPDNKASSIFNKGLYSYNYNSSLFVINNNILQYDNEWLNDIYKFSHNNILEFDYEWLNDIYKFSHNRNNLEKNTQIHNKSYEDIKIERRKGFIALTINESISIKEYQEKEFNRERFYNKELSKRTYDDIIKERKEYDNLYKERRQERYKQIQEEIKKRREGKYKEIEEELYKEIQEYINKNMIYK